MILTRHRITWADRSQLGRGLGVTVACCLLLALSMSTQTRGSPMSDLVIESPITLPEPINFVNCTSTNERQQVCLTAQECGAKRGIPGKDFCELMSGSGSCCTFNATQVDLPGATGTKEHSPIQFSNDQHQDPSIKMWLDWINKRMDILARWNYRRQTDNNPILHPLHADGHEHHKQLPDDHEYECGKTRADEISGSWASAKVVAGSPAMFGQYPWLISMRMIQQGNASHHFCSASLVGTQWALTAAHCLKDDHRRTQPAELVLRLGEHDLGNDVEYSPHEDVRVAKIFAHPGYNTQGWANDLALMKLEMPITYKKHILPVCLPTTKEEKTYAGLVAHQAGWGHTQYKGYSPELLLNGPVQVNTNEKCSDMIRTHRPLTQLCTSSTSEKMDACQSDSGGPLTFNINGRATQIGLASWAYNCGTVGPNSAVYTRLTAFMPWISEIMATK